MSVSSVSGWCFYDLSHRTEGEHQDVTHRLRAAHWDHGWGPEAGGRGLPAGQPMTGLHSLIDLVLLKTRKQSCFNICVIKSNLCVEIVCNKSNTNTTLWLSKEWCRLINYKVDFCSTYYRPQCSVLDFMHLADELKVQMTFYLMALVLHHSHKLWFSYCSEPMDILITCK